MDTVICERCENECDVDGEYPKFFSWCEACEAEPGGFDCFEYANSVLADMFDEAELMLDNER